jgi:hypothetical protein
VFYADKTKIPGSWMMHRYQYPVIWTLIYFFPSEFVEYAAVMMDPLR